MRPSLLNVFYLPDDELSLILRKVRSDVDSFRVNLLYGALHRFFSKRKCHCVAFGHAAPPAAVDVPGVDSVLVSVFVSAAGAGELSVFSADLPLPFLPPAESTGFL